MRDWRNTPYSGRVAHVSLRGIVTADRFEDGTEHYISDPVADLAASPNGPRERQLLRGAAFTVLDADQGCFFGFANRCGYAGWVRSNALIARDAPSHKVIQQITYAKSTLGLKAMGEVVPLSFGSGVTVTGHDAGWSKIHWSHGTIDREMWVPEQHLAPLAQNFSDPAHVAEKFLGSPYLWGGNTSFGIDCSGLVQESLLACGIDCPGDSDMQQHLFSPIPRAEVTRGDLVFWDGHVGMLLDQQTLIHANAHHMAVAVEPLADAIERIGKKEFGDVQGFARP